MALVALCTPLAMAHPKPGAHADVRISIEETGVRFDVLMNILFADQLVNAPRAARDAVTFEEEPALQKAMLGYFGGTADPQAAAMVVNRPNRVLIDGQEVTPVIHTLTIIHPEPETRPGFVQNPALLLPQIHVIAEYRAAHLPRTATLIWGTFPRDFQAPNRDTAPPSVVEAALTSQGDIQLVTFSQAEPEFTWHAPTVSREARFAAVPVLAKAPGRTFPLVSLAIAILWLLGVLVAFIRARMAGTSPSRLAMGASGVLLLGASGLLWNTLRTPLPTSTPVHPQPTEAEAVSIFTPLHANVYRAFDYTQESDIYDALARSVDGPMLDAVYNDVYRGLVMQEEGGAVARVRKVSLMETSLLSPKPDAAVPADGFRIRARWRVEGVVYHWGHSHTRENEYAAEYRVASRAGGWRIVDAVPLEQRRIQTPEQAASQATTETPPTTPSQQTMPRKTQ